MDDEGPVGLTDDEHKALNAVIDSFDPTLVEQLRAFHARISAAQLLGREPRPATSKEKQLLRRLAYRLREHPDYASLSLRAAELMLLMAAPNPYRRLAEKLDLESSPMIAELERRLGPLRDRLGDDPAALAAFQSSVLDAFQREANVSVEDVERDLERFFRSPSEVAPRR